MTAADRRLLESFARALADGKLHLVYQPKVSLRDGRLTRVEALFDQLLAGTHAVPGRLWGIGIGVPGPVWVRRSFCSLRSIAHS